MSKFRTSILIIGILIIAVAASLLTVLGLFMTGSVVTERIELFYSVYDAEKEYDGTPLVADGYELVSGELKAGHRAVIEITGSQTDAGKSKSSLTVKICNKNGLDVTDEYKIGVKEGTLKVTKKDIAVTLNDAEVMYNGSKVSFEDYTVTEGELVAGHKIAGSESAHLITVNDVLPSDLQPVVLDGAGNDVTHNYNVTFTMGNIQVVPRPVTVKPVDIIKTYDGKKAPVGEVEILSGSLAEGQYFKGIQVNYGERDYYIDAGEDTLRITKLAIYQRVGSKEVDVTENYELDYFSETGIVSIAKRKLTITAKSQSWVYDGTEHSVTNPDAPLSCEGLVDGELLLSVTQSATITDVGEETNRIGDITLANGADKDNYEIVLIAGTLTVTPRDVTVITPTLTKTYDGEPLEGVSLKNKPSAINLAPNHELKWDEEDIFALTNVGSETNEMAFTIENKNNEGADLSKNYNITYYYGTLTVTKRIAQVTTKSYSKVFDGTMLYGAKEDLSDLKTYNFVEWQKVGVENKDIPGLLEVGNITNGFKIYVLDSEGEDVTENYEIIYNYGVLEITLLNITVNTTGLMREYNGEDLYFGHDDTEFKTNLGELPEGLRAVLIANEKNYPRLHDVDRKENFAEYRFAYADYEGEGYSYVSENNYKLSYNYGYLEITPYSFNLKLNHLGKIYDGEPLELDYEEALEGNNFDINILPVSAFELAFDAEEVINAGTYTYSYVLGADYNAINYNITVTGGDAEITRLIVNVATHGYSGEYDNQDHAIEDIAFDTLPGGIEYELIEGRVYNNVRNVISVEHRVVYKLTKGGSDIDESNYEISYTYGYLEITPYEYTLNLSHLSKTYDAQPLVINYDMALADNLWTTVLPRTALVLSFTTEEVINAGAYTYTYELVAGYNPDNYDITVTGGEAEITKYYYGALNLNLLSKTYDGTAFDLEDERVRSEALNGNVFNNPDVLPWNAIVIDLIGTEAKNAGSYTYIAHLAAGYNLDNYDITFTEGRIEIKQCEVNVTLKDFKGDDSLTYSGKAQIPEINENTIMLIGTSTHISYLRANLSDMFEIVASGTLLNAGAYTYSIRFKDSVEANNHKLNMEEGAIVIKKYELTVKKPEPENKREEDDPTNVYRTVYNKETQLPKLENMINLDGLPEFIKDIYKDRLTIQVYGDAKNVGIYMYSVEFTHPEDYDNITLLKNDGKIIIEKCAVFVTLKDLSEQYNSKVHTVLLEDAIKGDVRSVGDIITNDDLADYVEIFYSETIKDAGEYTYGIRFIYRDDATNFRLFVNEHEGEVALYTVERIIVQLDIGNEITDAAHGKIYDGEVFTFDTVTAIKAKNLTLEGLRRVPVGDDPEITQLIGVEIPFDYKFAIDCATADATAGKKEAKFSNFHIYNDFGDEITRNFEYDFIDVAIEVTIETYKVTFVAESYITNSRLSVDEVTDDMKECVHASQSTPLPNGHYAVLDDALFEVDRNRSYWANVKTFGREYITFYNKDNVEVNDCFEILNEEDLQAAIVVITNS